MQADNKHNIFGKEELLKLIAEKKALPPEADDFDKEAFEGLAMLSDTKKLNALDDSIDKVLRDEKKKGQRRKNIYFLSAAASLLLIVGLFFILKDISFNKEASTLAENTQPVNEELKNETKALEENPATEKKPEVETSVNTPVTTATGESSGFGKEANDQAPPKVALKSSEGISNGDAIVLPSPHVEEVAAAPQTKAVNRKSEDLDRDERNAPGKDYKTSLAKDDGWKKEEAKKSDEKLRAEDKEKESDKKTRFETNTIWTSTPASTSGGVVVDESKNKSTGKTDDYRSQNQTGMDGNAVAGNNANISGVKKEAEVAFYEKQSSKGPEKKSKHKSNEAAKPDSIVTDMLAGYAYDAKPDKGLVQGGEPLKSQQTTAPVQTQNEVAATGSFAQTEVKDIPAEQKVAQGIAGKKGGKSDDQQDNTIANIQNAEPQNATRGSGAAVESAEFTGGTDALQQYVKKNLKISSPKKSGTVVAEFVVKKDGKIDTGTVKIVSKIKDCDPCSDDVKEMVKTMPQWKPARENGKTTNRKEKISVKYNADAAK